MTTVNEVTRIHTWLRTVLAADGTLNSAVSGRIYRGHVPQGESFPAVVFSVLSFGDDVFSQSEQYRVWSKARIVVKAVGETNSDLTLQTIADRIEAVLHAAKGGASDIYIDYCMRKKPFYYQEHPTTNTTYTHLGAEFELAARYAS